MRTERTPGRLPDPEAFTKAFGVGADPKKIDPVDACGVALAAVQGLQERMLEQNRELARVQADLAQARARLGRLQAAALNERK